jgi:hypothetical protein
MTSDADNAHTGSGSSVAVARLDWAGLGHHQLMEALGYI